MDQATLEELENLSGAEIVERAHQAVEEFEKEVAERKAVQVAQCPAFCELVSELLPVLIVLNANCEAVFNQLKFHDIEEKELRGETPAAQAIALCYSIRDYLLTCAKAVGVSTEPFSPVWSWYTLPVGASVCKELVLDPVPAEQNEVKDENPKEVPR